MESKKSVGEIPPAYDHTKFEKNIYELWEKSGAFTPRQARGKPPFTIIMPPPNANDNLHTGHARFVTIEDILTRYHRMKGEPTLWLPGADHAGIETQYVFEKKLKKEGKSRFDFERKMLYKMIWDFSLANKKNMENQLRALGASCDWSRNFFTLDAKVVKVVYKTFKKLYNDGLVYRGERIVNYCPRCGTTFSQLEVDSEERDDHLYYLDYGTVAVATTRPETIFADVAVAVNPKDGRYQKLVGLTANLPLINRGLPIVFDSLVDPGFGTGALKITPGHDALDFEIGRKHGLSVVKVIDEDGCMINTPVKYIGLKAEVARQEVIEDLKKAGKIKKVEKIHHVVGVCYRDKGLIEPMVSKQWFIKIGPLAKPALEAIKEGGVKFISKSHEKIAKHWLKNLKDWNISRQIVWGIRIPAWRCDKCMEWLITDGTEPKKCTGCGHAKLTQDPDTFDTWFSSGQWPYATLLSSKNSKFTDKDKDSDFNYFYPTSVMETGYDILPFWVIRMIMLGIYATGEVPFREVLLHGLVRDKEGQKISKSKGNVIDPLVMVEKYGADALRMALVWGALVENDIALSEENVRGMRNFANKIWNVSRFVLQNKTENLKTGKPMADNRKPRTDNPDDKWILNELKQTSKKVTKALDKYRLNEAAEALYRFVWHTLADIYIEKAKPRIRNSKLKIRNSSADEEAATQTLYHVLNVSLRLLHPFMPFVTEAIWSFGFAQDKSFGKAQDKSFGKARDEHDLLITQAWPKA